MNTLELELHRLKLPTLSGKVFLHVGCGEGDVCGYVSSRGALAVSGIDHDVQAITRARARYADVDFGLARWPEFLPTRRYDVVLMTSPLNLAAPLHEIVQRAMSLLREDALLILSLQVAGGAHSGWQDIAEEGVLECRPTRATLLEVLAAYDYELHPEAGTSSIDPTQRLVVHCRRRKLSALLVSRRENDSAVLARAFYKPGEVELFTEERAWRALMATAVGGRLVNGLEGSHRERGEVLCTLLDRGFAWTLVDQWFGRERPPVIVIDGFIADSHSSEVGRALESLGYIVWVAESSSPTRLEAEQPADLNVEGQAFDLAPGRASGAVDSVLLIDDTLAISGWAMDKISRVPISEFVIVYRAENLPILRVQAVERPDVAEAGLCVPGQTCGFHLSATIALHNGGGERFDPGFVQVYGLLAQSQAVLLGTHVMQVSD